MFAWASVVAWCFKNWKILGIGSLVRISCGGLAYWGHEKYVDGKKEGLVIATAAKKALADEQAAHRKDQLEWVATSQAIERHNAEIIVHKNAEIAILTSRFTETQKSLNQQKVKNAELAKQVFDPN